MPFIRAIDIASYSFTLFGSLGYGGLRGPPPDVGSYENSSYFLKYIFSPVLIIGSFDFYHEGNRGRGGGTKNAKLSLVCEDEI